MSISENPSPSLPLKNGEGSINPPPFTKGDRGGFVSEDFDNDLKYWLPFSYFGKFGPVRFRKILNYFPTMEEAHRASG
ncbi:MAG: hypothetical protein AAB731_00830, partial [Patescibacteria group bacterium]